MNNFNSDASDDDVSISTTTSAFDIDGDGDGDGAWPPRSEWVAFDDGLLVDIERNSPHVSHLKLYHRFFMSVQDWTALGLAIGTNTFLKCLSVQFSRGDNAEALLAGVASNRSLCLLQLDNALELRLSTLIPFVIENDNLMDFRVVGACDGLRLDDLQSFSHAFTGRRNPSSIKTIIFHYCCIDDNMVAVIVDIANCCPELRKLGLGENWIGNRGCNSLATLLRNPESKLKYLNLEHNQGIGGEGMMVLSNAVGGNKSLLHLNIGDYVYNPRKNEGWSSFFATVCDTSSIDATFQSNHTLSKLAYNYGYITDGDTRDSLFFALKANMESNSKFEAARKKILHFHLSGDFTVPPSLSEDAKLLPTLLGWIGGSHYANEDDEPVGKKELSAFFRVVHECPGLFGYPSPEKKRLSQVIDLLKEKNEALRKENKMLRNQLLRGNMLV